MSLCHGQVDPTSSVDSLLDFAGGGVGSLVGGLAVAEFAPPAGDASNWLLHPST